MIIKFAKETPMDYIEGYKVHRTTLKCIINHILRTIQFYTMKPFVIASEFNDGKFIRYKICRVEYKKR